MKQILLIISISIFYCCQNSTKDDNNKFVIDLNSGTQSKESEKNETHSEDPFMGWDTISIKNFKVNIPRNFEFQSSLSNSNKKVYSNESNQIALSIDLADVPMGYEDSDILEIIPNIDEFGKTINLENKKKFSDFQLKSTEKVMIKQQKAVMVEQTSRLISNNNTLMNVDSYFVISQPYYLSITFSYPETFKAKAIVSSIYNSFSFKKKELNNTSIGNEVNKNKPTLAESKDWLVNKLSKKVIGESRSIGEKLQPSSYNKETYKGIKIIDNSLIIEKKVENNYFGSFDVKSETTISNYRISIPFNKILYNEYDNYRTSNGECVFKIFTETNSIATLSVETGNKYFGSKYEFVFDCSEEETLGVRLNEAIMHIQSLVPSNNKMNNETF